MHTKDFYDAISRFVDTAGTQINAAETRRVLSQAFLYLSHLEAWEAHETIANAMLAARNIKKD